MYLTAQGLAQLYTTRELAEATYADERVLQVCLDDDDVSEFDPVQVDEARAAIARVNTALERASARIDSHLRVRYELPLPVSAVDANDIQTRAADIVRLQLWRYPSDEHRTRYNDAITWLKDAARGTVSLVNAVPGGGSGTVGATLGRVRTGQGRSSFDWSGY